MQTRLRELTRGWRAEGGRKVGKRYLDFTAVGWLDKENRSRDRIQTGRGREDSIEVDRSEERTRKKERDEEERVCRDDG